MPSSIPYDPSLVLGNIVEEITLRNCEAISALQSPIDAAQDLLNSYIAMKRSLDMTNQELMNMGVMPADIMQKLGIVQGFINKAATEYVAVRIAQEEKIQPLKALIRAVHSEIESPLDYVNSQLKTDFPISADTIKMDAQFFAYDENSQQSSNQMSSIKSMVSAATSFLGSKYQMEATSAAMSQVSSQRENHAVSGTLVITAACTHKMASIWAPLLIQVDKGIRAWNSYFAKDKLVMHDPAAVLQIAMEEGTTKETFLPIISGATYGSSFVGMVHTLNQTRTTSYQAMSSLASSLQASFEAGSWFAHYSGGFGVDASFSNDVKSLMSRNDLTSHITLICMGLIPSIKANQVKTFIKEMNTDPAETMKKLADLQNANASQKDSMSSAAQKARTGQQIQAIESTKIQSAVTAIAKVENDQNKMLDVNSLMTAFEDYVAKAAEGKAGVPINYYLKKITKAQLAQMWMAKYYPGYGQIAIQGDDSDKNVIAAKNPQATS